MFLRNLLGKSIRNPQTKAIGWKRVKSTEPRQKKMPSYGKLLEMWWGWRRIGSLCCLACRSIWLTTPARKSAKKLTSRGQIVQFCCGGTYPLWWQDHLSWIDPQTEGVELRVRCPLVWCQVAMVADQFGGILVHIHHTNALQDLHQILQRYCLCNREEHPIPTLLNTYSLVPKHDPPPLKYISEWF